MFRGRREGVRLERAQTGAAVDAGRRLAGRARDGDNDVSLEHRAGDRAGDVLSETAAPRCKTATHEIGQGVYTVCALIAADKLGIDPDRVSVELGDSDLPPAPVAGGSNSTASVGNAVAKACAMILAQKAAGANGAIEAYAENTPAGAPEDGIKKLYHGQPSFVGGASGKTDIRSFAFGAQFVEVRVHARTGEIRVPRATGAFAPAPSSIPRRRRASSWAG